MIWQIFLTDYTSWKWFTVDLLRNCLANRCKKTWHVNYMEYIIMVLIRFWHGGPCNILIENFCCKPDNLQRSQTPSSMNTNHIHQTHTLFHERHLYCAVSILSMIIQKPKRSQSNDAAAIIWVFNQSWWQYLFIKNTLLR